MQDVQSDPAHVVHDEFLEKGTIIADRYRVMHSLGAGGFAQVYLATHKEVDSLKVAIKVLHPSRTTPETLDRFRNEAKLLAMLRNRHTVKLTDFGVTDDGMAYLVMEYVEGTALDRVISVRGPMRDADVCRLGIGVLKALIEAHNGGVIHRDLKPANIVLVTEPGERHVVPRVLDFGIAKVLGGASPVEDHIINEDGSSEPVVYCTPAYAAPELLRGRPEFQTDLYALGLVMIEMLEGATPYEYVDEDPSASPHLWPSPVPLGLRTKASVAVEVIRMAVAKALTDRDVSAERMLADLEHAYEELRVTGRQDEQTRDYFTIVEAPSVRSATQPAMFVQTAAIGLANINDARAVADGKRQPEPDETTGSTSSPTNRGFIGHNQEEDTFPPLGTPTPPPVMIPPRLSSSDSPPSLGTPPPVSSEAQSVAGDIEPVVHAIPRSLESSRIANVMLFGQEMMSGRVTPTGMLVVVGAIVVPVIVVAWSVYRYATNN